MPYVNCDEDDPAELMDIELPCLVSTMMSIVRSEWYYLVLRVCPCADKHAHRQDDHTEDLQAAISFPSDHSSKHSSHTAEAAKYDVNRYADIEGECPVVEDIDATK